MRYRATFAAGFAAGYVLGARAGRQRYEQIMRGARRFAEKPEVQETAGALQAQAGGLAKQAKEFVASKVGRQESTAASGAPNGRSATGP